ncbi:E3 ubiquitin/ISG15 ligase TRIM25 [Triplophysa tibetana]|uniref:E3 ubiquitin/ISG15 ligase TRIM25 n=1 Tax=Triplophysa tibetana TaxID=1572043 RepID=A0A5A9PH39_9TELE|nr:E3 ubiquitin/ISG15 ligase TRIM25 [Triplophysa tibetana]
MAEASILWSQEQFSCSVCLDLLKDPVTVPCGHSYCMSCITGCWDQDDQKRVYSCPQCRKTFTPRPALGKNTILAEMVEKLSNTKEQAADPACYAGPGDVDCDVCIGRKRKSVKTCLMCLESYCQTHFNHHEGFHSGKRHKITDATGQLQEIICRQHGKIMDIYCNTDQQRICYLCMVDEHKNHETVISAAERSEKQTQLKEIQGKYQQRIQKMQTEFQRVKAVVETYKRSAQIAVEDNERIFTEIISNFEKRRSEVTELIREQDKAAVSQAEEVLKKLQQKIDDLKRRDAELEQLTRMDDHIHFLQSFQSLFVPPESSDSPSITVRSVLAFDDLEKPLSHLREKLEHFCKEEIEKISFRVKYAEIIPSPDPKTREEFLLYSHELTLDPNTLNKRLRLSEGNRVITNPGVLQEYPDHTDRFTYWYQGLCRESVCGRSYWEVEWSGDIAISVSYKSIRREGRGDECEFGRNDKSWSLDCTDSRYSFWHNNTHTDLPEVSRSSRIGVYVDYSAGTLSLYSVSDTMTLIYSIQTIFTHLLYPGFRLNYWHRARVESKVTLLELTM